MTMDASEQSGDVKLLGNWMTRTELANELGVSVATVARWHTEGVAPAFTKIGKRILYRRATVQQWLISRERGT